MKSEGIQFYWTFDKSIFKRHTIERLSAHLTQVLTEIVNHSDIQLSDIKMLSEREINYLVHELNGSEVNFPATKLIHEIFEQQVERVPDKTAIVFESSTYSYRKLNQAANQLAHYLIAQGVTVNTPVGICVDRSLDMVIAILAILKAGGAYVPLDPSYPVNRLQFMVTDSGIKHLLIQSKLTELVQLSDDIEMIQVDDEEFQQKLNKYSIANPKTETQRNLSNLAYIIYTSGSTGQPKGVLVPHRGVVRLVKNSGFMQLDETTRFLHAAPISFDAATLELWGPLLNGGCCVVFAGNVLDFNRLNESIVNNQVNSIWLTAGLFEQWSEVAAKAKSLRWILTGGDVVNPDAANRVYEALPTVNLINGYGPTENTTFSCCYTIPRQLRPELSIPIGTAINATQLYIVSSQQNLVPHGCVGELWLGGDGLADGYLNQDSLTQERFIQNPFKPGSSERLYKTGDLVKYFTDKENGPRSLESIGRIDEQVKIRGHRVELGEIESHLASLEQISSSLIVTRQDEQGQKHLVAYVIPENEKTFALNELKQSLQTELPHYMMPSGFVVMQEWPLTANGKIDKKALPAFDSQSLQDVYIAPQTETEKTLALIWSKLLKIDQQLISRSANFFELGGHSLLTVRLLAEIRNQLEQELTV